MEYTLIEGVSALGAFGILIIANNSLCKLLGKLLKFNTKSEKSIIGDALIWWLPIVGITYLSGFLGHIVSNSDMIFELKIKWLVILGLIFPLLIPHFEVFGYIINSYFQSSQGKLKNRKYLKYFIDMLIGAACGGWAGLLSKFIDKPNFGNSIPIYFFMLGFIIFLEISARIIRKTKSRRIN